MRLLIDEQLAGCGNLLRSIGYDVVLAKEVAKEIGSKDDKDLVEYAKKNNLFIITENNDMVIQCKFRNTPYLHLDVALKTKVIVEELKKMI